MIRGGHELYCTSTPGDNKAMKLEVTHDRFGMGRCVMGVKISVARV